MNRRVLTILLFAFIIASACAFLVYRLMSKNVAAARPAATTGVVAAAVDLKLGTVLTASNLKTIQIAGSLPKGAILKPENAIGRGVISDLYEGEPVIESRLAAPGTGGGLAATIPNGFRACAVKVDDVVGVAGFVTPGMRVDVLISGVPPMTPGQTAVPVTVSRTILQNIQVLSAGTDYQKDAEGKAKSVQVVNLLVTPEQAQTLSLASSQAKIQLVLRNPLDTKIDKIPGTATSNLFAGDNGIPVPASAPAPRARRTTGPRPVTRGYSIEIINGSTRTQEKVASPEDKK
jgi:pilus assembly protein CpaB